MMDSLLYQYLPRHMIVSSMRLSPSLLSNMHVIDSDEKSRQNSMIHLSEHSQPWLPKIIPSPQGESHHSSHGFETIVRTESPFSPIHKYSLIGSNEMNLSKKIFSQNHSERNLLDLTRAKYSGKNVIALASITMKYVKHAASYLGIMRTNKAYLCCS